MAFVERGAGRPTIHRPDHLGDLVCIDPLDDTCVDVGHLKQAVHLGVSGTALAEDNLPHPPITLRRFLAADDDEVTRTDVQELGVTTLDGSAVVDRHAPLPVLVHLYS